MRWWIRRWSGRGRWDWHRLLRMSDAQNKTTCCIVGGGPAGMVLGLLLARAGVRVTVLEKHKDFFRDFRGDTIHPATLELLHELGLLDEFLQLPHQKIDHFTAVIGGRQFRYRGHDAPAGAREVRGADAAVGFSELSGGSRAGRIQLRSAHGAQRYVADRRERPRGGCARRNAAGAGGDPRDAYGGLRRPACDRRCPPRICRSSKRVCRSMCCGCG